MNNTRKQTLANIIKEAEISKLAEESLEQTPDTTGDGQKIADDIFNKLLANIVDNIDSLG